jgi:type I restriction-modification system DNA methylase subunit
MVKISDVDPNEAISRLADTYAERPAAEPVRRRRDGSGRAPTKADTLADVERRLWDAANQLRANSNLRSSEYSTPVLGLIFLRYADVRFAEAERQLATEASSRRAIGKDHFKARGILYLPETARYAHLLNLPEGQNVAQAVIDAMHAIEAENEDLRGILPKTYARLDNATLVELLKRIGAVPTDLGGDVFGQIYEYFLAAFAMAEGQLGGEFFTPTAIVRLIVEMIEPFHGRIYDPACGSAACSSRAPASSRTITGTRAPRSRSTARRRPPRRSASPR